MQAAVAAAHAVSEDGTQKETEDGGPGGNIGGISRATSADSEEGGFAEVSNVLAAGGSSVVAGVDGGDGGASPGSLVPLTAAST